MDPLIGKTLAHFRVEERLGSGGMGVVYRARDKLLGRDVAIKILPELFASDSTRLSRLKREARLLASLNHPGIAAIYGLEKPWRGQPFLVLEFVQGETLAERLRLGPLTTEEALRIGGGIASALEAAHQRGVIHRDVKPGNVMLTSQGAVKVLDFGLGRHAGSRRDLDAPSSTTTTLTAPGHILGTPGYISPEQVLSRPYDRRVDVFGFGCVLYECLTGQLAFPGRSLDERLSAAVSRDPDWTALPVGVPQRLRLLLARCLQRDPERRLSEIGEAREEIEELTGALRERGGSRMARHISWEIPEPLTSFVGRWAQVEECLELLRRCRLVTFTGSGGCGKTRLALKVAEELRGAFPDGAWWVDLAPLSDPGRVTHTVASVLAVREEAGTPLLENLTERLATRRLLLILDNCEHVLTPCASLISFLLERCRDIVILSTSREPLHVPGEQVYPVPAMAVPDAEQSLRRIESVESVQLFIERARALAPHFKLSDETAPAVAEICRRLDGIPLAIELAAARVPLLTPEEIRGMLRDRFRLLVGSGPGLPRHKTLAAAIDWSYDQLEAGEQRLFRALAVFKGNWNLDGAVAVGDPEGDRLRVMNTLGRLVDKSLVLVDPSGASETRCRYLDTVRQYALAKLGEEGEEEGARERHVAYFVDMVRRAAPELTGPFQTEWLSRLEADHENLYSAFESCVRLADGDERALQLAGGLWRFWLAHGHSRIGRRILGDLLQREGARGASRTRAEALVGAGALEFHQNDWARSRSFFQECLEISRTIGYREGVGNAMIGLANVLMGEGDYSNAQVTYREAIPKFEEAGDRRGVGLALSNLGRVAELQENFESAWDLYMQGIDIFREVGDVGSLALRLSSLGDLSLKLGRLDTARDQLLESLRLIQDLEERRAGAYALARSAAFAAETKRSREAAVLYGASDALRNRIGPILTPREAQEHESRVARTRAEFGEEGFTTAWKEGQALSFDEGITYALGCLSAARPDAPVSSAHRSGSP